MTERLYARDSYLVRFEAEVVAARMLDGRMAVVLDRTAFYPEGGGQPADRGTLGGMAVADVQEEGGEVVHFMGGGAAPSGRVEGAVDWARRFDHMQQHHGQHLLSAAFERVLAAPTVAFHLGQETCTIDLDCPASRIDDAALRRTEAAANEAVWRDLPVTAREFSPEELAALPLRKEPVKGSRVVVVEGVDASPCGGTHPRRTGEVGAVAVLSAEKWGGGARISFVCGGRVVQSLGRAGERLAAVARALRCAPAEAPAAAARVAEESLARRKEAEALSRALASAEAERLAARAAGPVVARLEPPLAGAGALRAVAQALASLGRVAVLGGVEDGRGQLCIARPKGPGPHAGEVLREAVALLGGKGGGSPELAQGGGPDPARLAEALELASSRMRGGEERR